ncbi:hypothetical protein FZEAL_742 [Fusarium zealandicum]|uniref:Aminoglycoside phosphotransferase domain-containing protein n=1 Tax=Fusarium zealandicum TaxID=1053134 RepID=A0A8H4XQ41_9HYPO|nr:hypothetical protein FZEAL_742 [Fusarium zealandicum]
MTRPTREGLSWEDGTFGSKPRWKTEPRLEAIKVVCLRTLKLESEKDCTVEFYTAGAFNKLYLVEVPLTQQKLLMRVSLPVDPHNKTMGEVATLQWIRQFTSIPVPHIIAFDASSDNEIGFEWILMPLMPGTSAYSLWRRMSMTAKEALVKQVACFQEQILKAAGERSHLRGIGTLVRTSTGGGNVEASCSLAPGQLVSRHFFEGCHFNYAIPRGPFDSSREWLESFIQIIVQEQLEALETPEDDEDREDIEYHLGVAKRLLKLVRTTFPPSKDLPERTVPWHDDLSLMNILVDEKGAITAVLDWEFVSAMPYWYATGMPQFLTGRERVGEPVRDDYGNETPEEAEEIRKMMGDDRHVQDNEGKNQLYWINLMEYEQTRLRGVYTRHMRELRPAWDVEVADGALKDDFLGAAERCATGFPLKAIGRWMDALEKGEFPRLEDIL